MPILPSTSEVEGDTEWNCGSVSGSQTQELKPGCCGDEVSASFSHLSFSLLAPPSFLAVFIPSSPLFLFLPRGKSFFLNSMEGKMGG